MYRRNTGGLAALPCAFAFLLAGCGGGYCGSMGMGSGYGGAPPMQQATVVSVQLDTSGTPGALFGVVATVDSQGNQIIYFNDDNTNSFMRMTQ